MTRRSSLALAAVLFAYVTASGCSEGGAESASADPCRGETVRGFAVSLVSGSGGEPSPEDAASAQSGRDGWRVVTHDSNGATVISDRSLRHAIRGADGTWQVDRGHDC